MVTAGAVGVNGRGVVYRTVVILIDVRKRLENERYLSCERDLRKRVSLLCTYRKVKVVTFVLPSYHRSIASVIYSLWYRS